jgi:hypothetical protein
MRCLKKEVIGIESLRTLNSLVNQMAGKREMSEYSEYLPIKANNRQKEVRLVAR